MEDKVIDRKVTKIRKTLKPADVHHVPGTQNPADLGTRGLFPKQFVENSLWLQGPEFLYQDELPFTPFNENQSSRDEEELQTTLAVRVEEREDFSRKYSDFNTMIFRTLMIQRFIRRIKTKLPLAPPSAADYKTAKLSAIWKQQQIMFADEIKLIQQYKPLPPKHWMSTLSPFLDKDGILRVGGRLSRSLILPDSRVHPILLIKSHFVDLLIRDAHLLHGHAGRRLLETLICNEYWIPQLNKMIKSCIHHCNVCILWHSSTESQIMGCQPEYRITPAAPFTHTGVDFAGPFNVRPSKIKFEKVIKVWVAVFICMVTKSVHLEICSGLSTENFLDSFSRFASRRSTPTHLYSDNATNFKGAYRLMKLAWEKLENKAIDLLAVQNITWSYIPPGSPNQGGLWEAAVKTMKFFGNRMADISVMTQEEFSTLLCRIEFLMNSRPITPNPLSPNDPPALTPFHFLT